MKTLVTALILSVSCLTIVNSVAAQGPGGFRGGAPGGGLGGGMFGLLTNEQVQQEIDLVPAQEVDLRKLREDIRDRMRETFSRMRDASEEERRVIFAEAREVGREMEARAESILMPHQVDRVRQIMIQQQMRGRGGAGSALTSGRIADELGLTEEQIEELRKKAEEAQEEMRQKLEELRKQAEEKILSALTPEQRAKWQKMVGEPFEMQFDRRGDDRRGDDRRRGGGRDREDAGEL